MSEMDFDFYMPTKVISGVNCVSEKGDVLSSLGKRCLIVTGAHGAKESGALDDVLALCKRLRIEQAVYAGIGANPKVSSCCEGGQMAQAFGADFIVGIGGGSVMDATKAIAWLADNRPDEADRLFDGTLRHPPLPIVLIGTTAGTGSEVTSVSVLTLDKTGRKRSFSNPKCYARYVFADPKYTYSMSRDITVSTALDALCHATESFFVPNGGEIAALFDEKALPLLIEGLAYLTEHETADAATREALLYASLYAGIGLNATMMAFPHPFGYILTEDFGMPHGMASAVFLKALVRRGEVYAPEKAARLFALCGGKERFYGVLDAHVKHDVSMTEEQVAVYSERWQNLRHFTRTPGGYSAEEGVKLFKELFVQ